MFHVIFNCKALAGYAETEALVEAKGEHTMEEVCQRAHLSLIYNKFPAFDYSLDLRMAADGSVIGKTNSKDYDRESIMHYPSSGNSKVNFDPRPGATNRPEDFPLVMFMRKDYSPTNPPDLTKLTTADVRPIFPKTFPSPMDVQAVKERYVW
jgi:hypothetical protein